MNSKLKSRMASRAVCAAALALAAVAAQPVYAADPPDPGAAAPLVSSPGLGTLSQFFNWLGISGFWL